MSNHTGGDELLAAVSAGTLTAERDHAALLQSIVDVARSIVGARAASIMLLDEEADELVFSAVSGDGETTLIGQRFPAGTGIAGWTVSTCQPVLVEDLDQDERFARATAEATGYVPKALMAAPLVHRDAVLGVIEVLDWTPRPGLELGELDMLALFARQAAIAVDILRGALRAQLAARDHNEYAAVARVTAALEALDRTDRARGVRLLTALEEVLTR